MAASQPLSPDRRKAAAPKVRRFSLAQANKTLPLVRRVVADIVKTHARAADLQSKIEGLPASSKARGQHQEELEATIDRLQELVNELTEIGCELKDYETGLVDFIGRHKGHDVCLCWKMGEEHIGFFHELSAGFAGRQPIAALDEHE